MKNYFFLIVLIFAIAGQGYSQIKHEAEPLSFGQRIDQETPFLNLKPQSQKEKKPSKTENQPLYAGYKILLNDNETANGFWSDAKSGWKIWRIGISVENAKGLNVYFNNLNLSQGDRLFIYDENQSNLLGAFTDFNNGKYLGTEFINHNKVMVEFNTKNTSAKLPFEISAVGVSVLEMSRSERGFGDSQFCEILVNCPEGDNWKSERNGITRILISEGSGLYWCTGSLVNNTNLDGKPYLLTANHCGRDADEADYSQWVFYFNFESEDCEFPSLEPAYQSMSGAKLLARANTSTSSGSDFKLLLLADEVPSTYSPYYNGWDKSAVASSSGVGIHHPEGDLKMISTYTNSLVSTNYNNPTPDANGKYWMVKWSATESGHGVTEGGSSGSPIFDQNGFIVGALSGGRASCSKQNEPDYYGKFSYSWESNGNDSTNQLKPWLDPTNSGVERLRGINLDSNNTIANFTANPTEMKVGGLVTFFNQSQGDITSCEWYFEGGTPQQSELEIPPKIRYSEVGEFDVMLIAKSNKNSDTLILKDYIHVLPSLTPNPSAGHFTIHFGEEIPQDINITVTDMRGKNVNYFAQAGGENSIIIDLSQQASGVYLINVVADGRREVLKAMLISNSSFN